MVSWLGLSGHGTQVVAESTSVLLDADGVAGTSVVGLRRGWGTTFRGRSGAGCWFHQPVPAVNLFGHASATLGEIQLKFSTTGTARVTGIHVWSGDQRIKVYDGLSLGGAQTFSQLLSPELAQPGSGLDICAHVAFGASDSQVTFLGGYARFVTP